MSTLTRPASWPSKGYGNFQEAFIAMMVVQGHRAVYTRGNEHHRRFDQAVKKLRELQMADEPGAAELPSSIFPSMMGSYTDINSALQVRSDGLTFMILPFTGTVGLKDSPERAQRLLDEFLMVSPEAQDVLRQMVEAFFID